MKSFQCLLAFFVCSISAFSQNVGIGTNTPKATLDIFGGDSVSVNIHGIPNPIFSSNAVLRFSDGPRHFDINAHFDETPYYDALSLGNLRINRYGAVIIGGQPMFGDNRNSLTINHNANYDPGVALMVSEYADATPVNILFTNPTGQYFWKIQSFASAVTSDSKMTFTNSSGGNLLLLTGDGKAGINTSAVVAQTKLQINGQGIAGTTPLLLTGVQEYANNDAAIADGLPEGSVYRTGDTLKIVH